MAHLLPEFCQILAAFIFLSFDHEILRKVTHAVIKVMKIYT